MRGRKTAEADKSDVGTEEIKEGGLPSSCQHLAGRRIHTRCKNHDSSHPDDDGVRAAAGTKTVAGRFEKRHTQETHRKAGQGEETYRRDTGHSTHMRPLVSHEGQKQLVRCLTSILSIFSCREAEAVGANCFVTDPGYLGTLHGDTRSLLGAIPAWSGCCARLEREATNRTMMKQPLSFLKQGTGYGKIVALRVGRGLRRSSRAGVNRKTSFSARTREMEFKRPVPKCRPRWLIFW